MERDGAVEIGRFARGVGGWLAGAGGVAAHAGVFALAATALTLVNVVRTPGDLWFWRPLAVWGVVLAAHAALALGGAFRAAARPPAAAEQPELPVRDAVVAPPSARRSPVAGPTPVPAVSADTWMSAASASAAGHAADDGEESFASWAQATGAWAAGGSGAPARRTVGWRPRDRERRPAPGSTDAGRSHPAPLGGRAWSAASTLALRVLDGADPATNPATDGAAPRPAPPPAAAPTGRFQGPPPVAAEPAPPAPGDPSSDLPAAVEALWSPNRPGGSPAPRPPVDAGFPPPAPGRRTSATNGRASATNGRAAHAPGQDIVLNGPVPLDPHDPQWAWLEAAASNWLASRETNGDGAPPPPHAGPNGASGANGQHGDHR